MSLSPPAADIAEAARAAIYDVIAKRRDVRLFQVGVPVPDDALVRILYAAHLAPSVGFSQPWDFLVVRDAARRQRIRDNFLRCRQVEAGRFPPERREKYLGYRLEGIVESALNLCVTVDLRPAEEAILGTTAQPEALRWSACCAVENLWLAARAEGIGVGWVSIVEPAVLRAELELPPGIEPVAYLCVGVPVEFRPKPMLEETGWRPRKALCDAIHTETYRAPQVLHVDHPTAVILPDASDLPEVPAFDPQAADAARAHQARLTKPVGSLGRLEELAIWYAGARGRFPVLPPTRSELLVFAADHGVVAEGISPYPSSVTAQMVQNFLAGGAAVNALARSCGIDLTVVDVGVAGDLTGLPADRQARFVPAKVRAGTRNFRREKALSHAEVELALRVGVRMASEARERGAELLLAGEMGIGNTTTAAAVLSALTGLPPEEAVGRGTGLNDHGVAHKAKVVREALARHAPAGQDPRAVLCAVGGLEICAMAGLMLGGAACRIPVVVDGFISGTAALVAVTLRPAVRDYLCLAHLSAERGHRALCEALRLRPVLDLEMRLGEGTGAILAAHLVGAAVRAQAEMATFATAGIADRVRAK